MSQLRILFCICLTGLVNTGAINADDAKPRSRTFLFTYSSTISGLAPGKAAHIWLPIAPVNDQQDVEVIAKKVPGRQRFGQDAVYGNPILSTVANPDKDGKIALEVAYKVTRREVQTHNQGGIMAVEAERRIKRFLQPDAKVPIDGKPLELIQDKKVPEEPLPAARLFYDVVNKHMTYAKDTPGWGNGDSAWACTSGRGNCSDFHSLFISLARSAKIPAKFEMGFPLPEKHGAGAIPGYHCWAWFMPKEKVWVPVDISEANKNPKMADYYFGNLTPDRVLFSTGRDIELVPRQKGPALNFFIYPYVEVDGKAYASSKIKNAFTFKDVEVDR